MQTARDQRRLDQILLARGVISEQQICAALEEQRLIGGRLGEHLLQRGDLTDEELLDALSEQFGVPAVDLVSSPPERHVLERLDRRLLEERNCVPAWYDSEGDTLAVAFSDPADRQGVAEVENSVHPSRVQVCVALESHIHRVLRHPRPTVWGASAVERADTGEATLSEKAIEGLIRLLEMSLVSRGQKEDRQTPRPVWAARLANEVCLRLSLPTEIRHCVRLACLTADSALWHRQRVRSLSNRDTLALSGALLRGLGLPWDVAGLLDRAARDQHDLSPIGQSTDIVRVVWAIADGRRGNEDLNPLDTWREQVSQTATGVDPDILDVAFSVLRGQSLRERLAGHPWELIITGTGPLVSELLEAASNPPYRIVPSPTWTDAMALAKRRLPDVLCVEVACAHVPDSTTLTENVCAVGLEPSAILFLVESAIPDPVAALVRVGARAHLASTGGGQAVLKRIAKMLTSHEVTKIRRQGPPRTAAEPLVKGRLNDLAIADMIQVLSSAQKSCRVDLTRPGGEGVLWFDKGEIIGARSGHLAGDQAFFDILGWPEGAFEVHPVAVLPGRNITTHTTGLLLEGFRRLDESRRRVALRAR